MPRPGGARPLLAVFRRHVAAPTYTRFVALTAAAVRTPGRRTVADGLRTAGEPAPGRDARDRRGLPAAEGSAGRDWGAARPDTSAPV